MNNANVLLVVPVSCELVDFDFGTGTLMFNVIHCSSLRRAK